jgi:uncharacterized RDD family membrane protein YckC
MQIVCGKCHHVLEFSKERPSFCSRCGQALTETRPDDRAAHDPNAPTLLPAKGPTEEPGPPPAAPGYRMLRALGAGGMGTVYEAEETASGRRVAIKIIGPEYAESADAVERFRQEGRLASMLSHPRCVFVLTASEEAGRPYIVMELMPGDTLNELVDRRGPLAPEEAVAKILDVIDGLQEAHRLEIIHRDVKPSNCFLEADGRVKVGDFGLAKSLLEGAPHLTRTGAFLGTLFFASPEQVRSDPVGPQTDVYSVAATLYYLLTGRAPFQSSDAAATLARIVSDRPPPLRSLRPELSPALDRVVRRGLERDLEVRWPDLESFKHALLSLTPKPLDAKGLVPRFAAYLIDEIVLGLGGVLPLALGATIVLGQLPLWQLIFSLLLLSVHFLYFAVFETFWGATPGKWLFGLRVGTVISTDPPSLGKAALRSLWCTGLLLFGYILAPLMAWFLSREAHSKASLLSFDHDSWLNFAAIWQLLGSVVVVLSMRPGNGFRGLHEMLSGTRVFEPYRDRRQRALFDTGGWLLYFLRHHSRQLTNQPRDRLPERIAGFTIRGGLKWTANEKILLGEDASLGRRVFIWLRPADAPSLDRARREVGRRARLRWLASGRQGDQQWDAILAPSGCPLPELVHSEGRLSWAEARRLLEALAGELDAACADGTLPPSLTVDQVWVQPDGRAQLADTPLTESAAPLPAPAGQTDADRSLALLRQVAVLALEGRTRPTGGPSVALQAPFPANARAVLDRLVAVPSGYETVEQFQAALAATPEAG